MIVMSVFLDDDTLTIHGWLWSRTVSRSSVVNITEPDLPYPAVHWIDDPGRRRRSLIVMFPNDYRYSTIAASRRTTSHLAAGPPRPTAMKAG